MLSFRSSLCVALPLLLCCGGDEGDDNNGQNNRDSGPAIDSAVQADGPTADAPPVTACANDLGTVADGSSATENDSNIVISEIDPGEFIEVYNASDATVQLGATGYAWCNNRSYPTFAGLTIEIPAGGRRTIPWPGGTGVEAGGDVSIYSQPVFNGGQLNILDYVCWGDPTLGGVTRRLDAEGVDKWVGDCAQTIPAGGSLQRLPNVDGTDAADYAALNPPAPENCD